MLLHIHIHTKVWAHSHFYEFSFFLSCSLVKHSHRFLTHIPAGLLFLCTAVITLWLDMEWNKPPSFPAQLPLLYHSSSIQRPPPRTKLSIGLLSRWLFLASALLFWNLLLTGCCWVSGRRSLQECLAHSQTTPESQCRADGSGLWLQLWACWIRSRRSSLPVVLRYFYVFVMYPWQSNGPHEV